MIIQIGQRTKRKFKTYLIEEILRNDEDQSVTNHESSTKHKKDDNNETISKHLDREQAHNHNHSHNHLDNLATSSKFIAPQANLISDKSGTTTETITREKNQSFQTGLEGITGSSNSQQQQLQYYNYLYQTLIYKQQQ